MESPISSPTTPLGNWGDGKNQDFASNTGQILTRCERGTCLQNPLPKSSSFIIGNYEFKITKVSTREALNIMAEKHGFDIIIRFTTLNVGKEAQDITGFTIKLYDNQERRFDNTYPTYFSGQQPGFTKEYEARFNVPSMDSPYVLQIKDKYILIGV